MSAQDFESGFQPGDLSPEYKATEAMRRQAAKHAKHGVFQLKDREPGYRQDFSEIYFPPMEEPDLDNIDSFARLIMGTTEEGVPRFDIIRQAFNTRSAETAKAAEAMEAGKRVLIVTPHRELADVAMALAAEECEIGEPSLIGSTRIFIGPLVKELKIKGLDAIDALRFSAGVLVGFPDTANTKRMIEADEIDADIKKAGNDKMLSEFTAQIKSGEIKQAIIAASGSTDDETNNSILMKPVSRSTNIMARRFFDYIWPVALVMSKERTACEVGRLIQLGKGEDLHDVMEKYLAPMYERVSGKKVSYERGVSDPRLKLGAAALKESGD